MLRRLEEIETLVKAIAGVSGENGTQLACYPPMGVANARVSVCRFDRQGCSQCFGPDQSTVQYRAAAPSTPAQAGFFRCSGEWHSEARVCPRETANHEQDRNSTRYRGGPVLAAAAPTMHPAVMKSHKAFARLPRHVGFIPDGNRRWAKERTLPASAGYEAGIAPGLALIDMCRSLGIEEVSIYGFTQDNTRRPSEQTAAFRDACVKFARGRWHAMRP